MTADTILGILVKALVLFTAFPIHEYAHGWAADKMGDHTARNQGRLTINPFAHLDLLGTISMFLVGFGWAKPVPINPNNFKNRKWGMAISAFAGPMSNILMAYIAMIIYKIILYSPINSSVLNFVLSYIIILNLGLAVFNLLPIPPLDGSRIATLFLPEKTYFKIMQYESIIFIVLLVIIWTGIVSTPLSYLRGFALSALDFLTGYIDIIAKAVVG